MKKEGYRDEIDIVSVRAGTMTNKNYDMVKVKKSRMGKWIIYAVIGGGAVYVATLKKEKEKKGSLSVTISIPN